MGVLRSTPTEQAKAATDTAAQIADYERSAAEEEGKLRVVVMD